MSNEINLLSKTNSQKVKKEETITELAHRHLLDQNHTTSDEELMNVQFKFSDNSKVSDSSLYEIDNTTITEPLSVEATNGSTDYRQYKDNKSSAPNPFDVLGG